MDITRETKRMVESMVNFYFVHTLSFKIISKTRMFGIKSVNVKIR